MKPLKRLFLFAAFDKDNIVDDTLIYYIKALSKFGDIVFVMDNNLSTAEIQKISKIPNVLYTNATKHGEYDFGSYKRGYIWAQDKQILKKYDWVYFVNDSVYGPLYDLTSTLESLEKSDADLIGMISSHDESTPWHIQSWFVGFSKKIFTSDFFNDFIKKITYVPDRLSLIMKYEVGLSCRIMRHGFKAKVLFNNDNDMICKNARLTLTKGLPFIKKRGIASLRKMYFLYPYTENDELVNYISADMQRHNVKMVKDSFQDVYNLRFLRIPLLRITAKRSKIYKVYIFKYIPVLKITK